MLKQATAVAFGGMVLAMLGCGDTKKADEESPTLKARREAKASSEEQVGKVNDLVPSALKAQLSFEPSMLRNDSAAVLVPKAWETVFEGNFRAPSALGFGTNYWVSSNCDGMCSPKDWAEVSDKVDFKQFSGDGWKVLKDEKSDGMRVLVAEKESLHLVVAKWQEGADRYYACRATLAPAAKEAAQVFEAACRAMIPIDWD